MVDTTKNLADAARAILSDEAHTSQENMRLFMVLKDALADHDAAQVPPSDAEGDRFVHACTYIDWAQHLLSGGGCFHVDDDLGLCGRAERWAGHHTKGDDYHLFVPLHVAVSSILRRARPDAGLLRAARAVVEDDFRSDITSVRDLRAEVARVEGGAKC